MGSWGCGVGKPTRIAIPCSAGRALMPCLRPPQQMNSTQREELYRHYETYALYLARQTIGQRGWQHLQEDVEQEARLALWEAILSYNPSRNANQHRYLLWKTRNLLRNRLRRYQRWQARESFPLLAEEEPMPPEEECLATR